MFVGMPCLVLETRITNIQAPIGACIMRPGETRQSDTRQKHGHRFNSNLPKKIKVPIHEGFQVLLLNSSI